MQANNIFPDREQKWGFMTLFGNELFYLHF
jgi:hypothetical protein